MRVIALLKLGKLQDMDLKLIRIQLASVILPEMKTGVKFFLFLKEHKIQNPHMDTFPEHPIALSLLNLPGIHLSQIKQISFLPIFLWRTAISDDWLDIKSHNILYPLFN